MLFIPEDKVADLLWPDIAKLAKKIGAEVERDFSKEQIVRAFRRACV